MDKNSLHILEKLHINVALLIWSFKKPWFTGYGGEHL